MTTTEPILDELDIANWTALRMREMHIPIKEGKFMPGVLTPHQYLTKEIEALISAKVLEARIDEFEGINLAMASSAIADKHEEDWCPIEQTVTEYIKNRLLVELAKLKEK